MLLLIAMQTTLRSAALLLAAAWASTEAAEAMESLRVQGRTTIASADTIAPHGVLITEGAPMCDDESNIILRISGGKGATSRLVRVSADGKKTLGFDVTAVPGHEHDSVINLAVGPDGQTYVATIGPKHEQAILKFNSEGRYKSALRIDPRRLSITSFGVFSADALLIAGYAWEESDTTARPKPTTGIFNGAGDLVAPLVDLLEGASERNESAEQQGAESLAFDDLGSVERGGDGTLYFVRPKPEGPVFGVSAAGEVVSKIKLAPPKRAQTRTGIRVYKQRLAVSYSEESDEADRPARSWIHVYDLTSGEKTAEYATASTSKLHTLACYTSSPASGDVFTMLGWDPEGRLQLVRLSR